MLVHDDEDKLRISTTKVFDFVSAGLDGIKHTMPSAIIMKNVAYLQTNVTPNGGAQRPFKRDGSYGSKVGDRLTMREQNSDSNLTPALTGQFSKTASWPRKIHAYWILNLLSHRTHPHGTLKRSPGSVVEPHITDDTRQRVLVERRILDTPGSRSDGPPATVKFTLSHVSVTN